MRHATHRSPCARGVTLGLLFAFLSAGPALAADPAGMIFAQPGKLSAKLQKVGGLKGEAPNSTVEFGPRTGVPAGTFRLIVDDGFDTLTLTGDYTFDGKKVALMPDPNTIAADIEALIEAEGPFDANVDCVNFAKAKSAAKSKVKEKNGIYSAATKVKVACGVTLVGFPTEVKIKLGFKGKGDAL